MSVIVKKTDGGGNLPPASSREQLEFGKTTAVMAEAPLSGAAKSARAHAPRTRPAYAASAGLRGVIATYEIRPTFHQCRNESNIAAKAVELRDDEGGPSLAALLQSGQQLRAVGMLLAALNLYLFCGELTPLRYAEARQRVAPTAPDHSPPACPCSPGNRRSISFRFPWRCEVKRLRVVNVKLKPWWAGADGKWGFSGVQRRRRFSATLK